jgi:hypothetical protein
METETFGTAETLINQSVLSGVSSSQILASIDAGKEQLEAQERAAIDSYIQAMRPIYAAMIVDEFSGNTAGLYDGSQIYVDQSVMMVGQSVDTTIAQAQEVYEHEHYHQTNNHLAPMQVVADVRDGVYAVIGGVSFTQTELIEGLTVAETGNQFVSAEYKAHERALRKAASASGVGLQGIAQAVNVAKDITHVDDRTAGHVNQLSI